MTLPETIVRYPLRALAGRSPEAPEWFRDALAHRSQLRTLDVAGALIESHGWGHEGQPGMLMLHGNGGSADWWRFIAPLLADQWRVVAPSLSGMGGSGWRPSYSIDIYVEEVVAVAEAWGLFAGGPLTLVGHSFGGFVALACAARFGELFAGAIVVDSPLLPDTSRAPGQHVLPSTEQRRFSTLEEGLDRFRFMPEQECENIYIADFIARASLHRVEADGDAFWSWRADPRLWQHNRTANTRAWLAEARCPVSLIYGGSSQLVSASTARDYAAVAGRDMPTIEIPGAAHHVMVDQPLALVDAVRTLARMPAGSRPGAR